MNLEEIRARYPSKSVLRKSRIMLGNLSVGQTFDDVRFLLGEVARLQGELAGHHADLGANPCPCPDCIEHRKSEDSGSTYTLRKLVRLWLNMFLNFSITPLRVSALLGTFASVVSLFLLVAIIIDRLYINPDVTLGIPTVLVVVVFFAGVQLVILGTMGEYLGRLFLDHSKAPQFVVRYLKRGESSGE